MRNKIKRLFETPKKAALSIVCVLAILLFLGTGTVYAADAIAKSTAIGAENAQNFAFADAGIDPAAAKIVRTEFGFEHGQFVYEVEFVADGTEYEYWIKSSDGTVVKKEIEIVTQDGAHKVATAEITADEAKEIALADAGLTVSDVTFTEEKLDLDDSTSVYELKFYTGEKKYEYEINATTGAVFSKSTEAIVAQNPPAQQPVTSAANSEKPATATPATGTQSNSNASSGSSQIGVEAAKNKALADAGLSASAVTFTKARLDYDDRIAVYDVEFYTSTHEYEYEINASTGAVHDKSVEAFKSNVAKPGNNGSNSNTGNYISVDKAKEIAVGKAGLSVSGVTFQKAKLDYDDGRAVYEIEFFSGGVEYECEVDASSGTILDYSSEREHR